MIYWDCNSTTFVHPLVLESMMPYFSHLGANPSSPHDLGRKARCAIDSSREKVAQFLKSTPEEIFFTSGGTESNNLAIKGFLLKHPQKKHLVVSAIEHSAVANIFEYLQQNSGYRVSWIKPSSEGQINPSDFINEITEDTALVSLMLANNETGVIQPVSEIAEFCKKKGLFFHTDAVQCGGKIEIDVNSLNINSLSLSAHKFYGPKGIGILYLRRGSLINALFQGGSHEHWLRPGTENVPGIVGVGKAVEVAFQNMDVEIQKEKRMIQLFETRIHQCFPSAVIHSEKALRLPNTSYISFPGNSAIALQTRLDMEGIAVSTGAACSSGATHHSRTLQAMGISSDLANSAIRFSIGLFNEESEIESVINSLKHCIENS